MREEYRVFQIDKQDTVATALQDIPSGGAGTYYRELYGTQYCCDNRYSCRSQDGTEGNRIRGRNSQIRGVHWKSRCIYSPGKLGTFTCNAQCIRRTLFPLRCEDRSSQRYQIRIGNGRQNRNRGNGMESEKYSWQGYLRQDGRCGYEITFW